MTECYEIYPIGIIKKRDTVITIDIYEKYKDAFLGIDQYSHIFVCYWFHRNDTLEQRSVLQVHPRNNKSNPLSGVFATHAPVRPNLIAISICKIISIIESKIQIDEIDAIDETPLIDIKPYIPSNKSLSNVRVPEWI